jgi:hypothetical protein
MQVAQYMVGVCFASFNTLVDIEEPFTATITANGQTVERVAEMLSQILKIRNRSNH